MCNNILCQASIKRKLKEFYFDYSNIFLDYKNNFKLRIKPFKIKKTERVKITNYLREHKIRAKQNLKRKTIKKENIHLQKKKCIYIGK